MDTALWIAGSWIGLSITAGILVLVAAVLRDWRDTASLVPVRSGGVSRPGRGKPRR